MKIIPQKFYSRNTLTVAKDLLGCFLVRKYRGKITRAMIIETEAYRGEKDLACHASRGRTPRTETLYGEAGHAYVYLIYGMYYNFNVVAEKKGFPAGILIRGIKIRDVPEKETNGPGKICRFLKIDKKLNRWDLTKGKKIWIELRDSKTKLPRIQKSKRIGIDYAEHCREYLWRFTQKI